MIDPARLRQLRHDRGLSQRRLAASSGVDPLTIQRLEAGADTGDLPLRVLTRIADTLSVHARELLNEDSDPPKPADSDLAARIGAALLAHGPTTITSLATALDATIDALEAALPILRQALTASGMTVARHGEAVSLAPAKLTRTTAAAERALTLGEARLLRRIHRGEDVRRSLSFDERQFVLPALLRRGLINDSQAILRVTDAVADSLSTPA